MKQILTGFLFLLVTGYLAFGTFQDYSLAKSSEYWKPVTAVITSTTLNINMFQKGSHYDPVVNYRYSVNGKSYDGSQISYPAPKSCSYDVGTKFLTHYPVNASLNAYYDPLEPTRAVLKNSLDQDRFNDSLGIVAVLACMTVVFFIVGITKLGKS